MRNELRKRCYYYLPGFCSDESAARSICLSDRVPGGLDVCFCHVARAAWHPRAHGEAARDPGNGEAEFGCGEGNRTDARPSPAAVQRSGRAGARNPPASQAGPPRREGLYDRRSGQEIILSVGQAIAFVACQVSLRQGSLTESKKRGAGLEAGVAGREAR